MWRACQVRYCYCTCCDEEFFHPFYLFVQLPLLLLLTVPWLMTIGFTTTVSTYYFPSDISCVVSISFMKVTESRAFSFQLYLPKRGE